MKLVRDHFYTIIVALVMAALFLSMQIKLPLTGLLAANATSTNASSETATLISETPTDPCSASARPQRFFYHPDRPTRADKNHDRLLISGTVYASDSTTRLAGALVEVWRADAERTDSPQPDIIFRGQFRTDAAGRYEFTTMKPDRPDIPYLNLRVSYKDHCPILIQLHILAEPLLREALIKDIPSPAARPAKPFSARTQVTGPVLHGPVDIVLPVRPPLSE